MQSDIEIIALLNDLLGRAKRGEITSIMVGMSLGSVQYAMTLAGNYAQNPMDALAVVERIRYRLNVLAESQELPCPAF